MSYPKQVYAIQHKVTRRIYIGSSECPSKRYMSHIYNLRKGKHPVEDMQDDFDKYGEAYAFYILDEMKGLCDRKKEYEWMKRYNTFVRGVGYNYKDREEKTLYFNSLPSYSEGLPMPFDKGEELPLKDEYIAEITKMITECTDLSLLDLVHKILKKSGCDRR